MVFGLFTDMFDSALKVTGNLVIGEVPSRRDVAKLLDAGFTIAGIAAMLDVGEDVVADIVEDDNDG